MVGTVKLSITRSWVLNRGLPDERSNRKTSRKIGFYSVYLVSLQGLPFIQLYMILEISNFGLPNPFISNLFQWQQKSMRTVKLLVPVFFGIPAPRLD